MIKGLAGGLDGVHQGFQPAKFIISLRALYTFVVDVLVGVTEVEVPGDRPVAVSWNDQSETGQNIYDCRQ